MALVGIWTNQLMSVSGWTRAQQEHNVTEIWGYFGSQGWTLNAVSAMLGNMELESYINPAQWEIGKTIEDPVESHKVGFGLVQWTHWTKFANWAGPDWRTNYTKQLQRIDYEVVTPGEQWIALAAYNYMSFAQFTQSMDSVDYLTEVFVRSYERPGDWQQSIAIRRANARAWYEFLSGTPPIPPTPSGGSNKLKIMFYLKPKWKRGY